MLESDDIEWRWGCRLGRSRSRGCRLRCWRLEIEPVRHAQNAPGASIVYAPWPRSRSQHIEEGTPRVINTQRARCPRIHPPRIISQGFALHVHPPTIAHPERIQDTPKSEQYPRFFHCLESRREYCCHSTGRALISWVRTCLV